VKNATMMRLAAMQLIAGLAPAVLSAQFPTKPPAASAIKPAQFPPFQTATLSNGMKLLVVSNRRLPVISVSLSFNAGGKYDPEGKAGTADMVAALLTKGAGTRNAEAVSAAIEGVGGSISASAGADFLGVDGGALSENAALAFELLADAVIRPNFDDKEIEIYRTQALSSLQLEQSQPASIASRIFAAELYGKHPYGRRADAASVKSITKADLVAFQKARLRPTGALLVLAGDITLARAQQMAEAAFKGWAGAAPAPLTGAAAAPARTATEIVLVHRAGSVQSNIVAGNTTWNAGDPRHYAATLANRVLGGGSDARLFMILREAKGWTYGSYSSLTRQQGMGNFSATAEVRTEVTDSSLKELMTQFKRIGEEPIPAKEFEDAKSALVGRFPLQVETAAQVAGQVSNAQLLGLPSDYVQTYRQKLAAVTPAAAQAAAKAAIQPDRMLAVVVGDGSKLYDKLKAIAPVRVVSIDGTPLRPEDLVVKAAALDVAVDRLAPRTDSFVVMVQGNPFGFQRGKLEKSGSGWKYTEDTNLGPIMSQHTEVTFDGDLTPGRVTQTGQQQGQQAKIEVSYAGGRAKGSATTPAPTGPKTVQVDAELVKGMIDDNMVQVLLPTFRWAAGAKFTVSVFQSGKGEPSSLTLTVSGEESVTVPAGTFAAWKVDMTGGEAPVTFHVEKAAPHRLVKIAIVGAPIEMRLAK
jgi:zinc protease